MATPPRRCPQPFLPEQRQPATRDGASAPVRRPWTAAGGIRLAPCSLHSRRSAVEHYCTKSPDSWDRADFKDPCANHDLCYEDPVRGKQPCDQSLRDDMEINCGFAFDQDGGDKDRKRFETCYRMAAGYYEWVRRTGDC